MRSSLPTSASTWDMFCAVVDNFGDIGVCWRLARQLRLEFGLTVRLWVDNLERFAQLLPDVKVVPVQSVQAVEIRHWTSDADLTDAADVVIEAFACELPERYVAAMASRAIPPVWLNLEYLSAEAWVEDCHLLQSPNPRWPLAKTFFFPGFTARTGGVLCEHGLRDARSAFDESDVTEFWNRLKIPDWQPNETRISLFCYNNPQLADLLECWSHGPEAIRLLVTPGAAAQQCGEWFHCSPTVGTVQHRGALTSHWIPFLSQDDYDRLLWTCDINFVRGEDSFVRAQWAGRPFVWQIYPQSDLAHWAKLQAFLMRYAGQAAEFPVLQRCWRAWNGDGEMAAAWAKYRDQRPFLQQQAQEWVDHLDHAGNLADNLVRFVEESFDRQDGNVK